MWPASSLLGASRPITPTDAGAVAVAAAPAAAPTRLAGIDHRHRQPLPLKGIRLFGLDIHLAYQIQFLAPHGNEIHFGRAVRMRLAPRPRLEGMPPKTPSH